jgi:hypothetical protein
MGAAPRGVTILAVGALGLLILAACQGAPAPTASPSAPPTPSSTPTAVATPTPAASPIPTPTIAATFPSTVLTAKLDIAYDSTGAPYDPAKLGGLKPGQVEASWYQNGSVYVIVYTSVDPNAAGGLCPGNSIETANGFEHVSNAPTAPGACKGEERTLAAPPVGVRLCPSLGRTGFAYVTAIPAAAAGVLYASVEKAQPGGAIVGVTGRAPTSAGSAPKVDLDALGCAPVPGV